MENDYDTSKEETEIASQRIQGREKEQADPPIIVGGGGSTYIFVRKDYSMTPQPNPHPDYPIKLALYDCYEVDVDITVISVNDGVSVQNPHPVKHGRRQRTRFI